MKTLNFVAVAFDLSICS